MPRLVTAPEMHLACKGSAHNIWPASSPSVTPLLHNTPDHKQNSPGHRTHQISSRQIERRSDHIRSNIVLFQPSGWTVPPRAQLACQIKSRLTFSRCLNTQGHACYPPGHPQNTSDQNQAGLFSSAPVYFVGLIPPDARSLPSTYLWTNQ